MVKAEIRWIVATITMFLFVFILETIKLLPISVLFWSQGVMKLFIALGILGVVAADYGIFLRINQEMEEEIKSTIKVLGFPILIIAGIFATNICFSISVLVGLYLYGLTQLGLIITLFWASFEIGLAKIKWFLSPSILFGTAIIFVLKYVEMRSHESYQTILTKAPDGNLNRALWELSHKLCKDLI